ncbi:acetylornithine deacetylase [Roseovarius atlanticus]|uniref:acetylornithine deacetylase n=1 Tax=Roseovarius atlanticus TaxID=1641875 RepID=UPI0021BD07DF|nr:acetylornithine deacetylase [Roseovarius atlanticus]
MRQDTDEALEILEKLVAFDTTSTRSNLDLIAFIETCLSQRGIRSHRVGNADQTKANLWARIGPDTSGGLLLSGHTDVVPAPRETWRQDPWTLKEADGKVFGRGTCDMKGFIACCLHFARHVDPATLAEPIYLALSYDEEVGCLGVPSLIQAMKTAGARPRVVIVGEPTEMAVVNAHKATFGVRTVVHGKAAHSAHPGLGASATVAAAEIAMFLAGQAGEMQQSSPQSPRFDPPFATLNVGILSGGEARNIVAPRAEVQWDCRLLPGQDPDEPLARLQHFVDHDLTARPGPVQALRVETERLNFMPALGPEPDGQAEYHALAASQTSASRAESYGTEAGFFQQAGWSTVVCGPGSIRQAHTANEYIEIDQIDRCLAFLDRLVATFGARSLTVSGAGQ